jgi:hypothetical protein
VSRSLDASPSLRFRPTCTVPGWKGLPSTGLSDSADFDSSCPSRVGLPAIHAAVLATRVLEWLRSLTKRSLWMFSFNPRRANNTCLSALWARGTEFMIVDRPQKAPSKQQTKQYKQNRKVSLSDVSPSFVQFWRFI